MHLEDWCSLMPEKRKQNDDWNRDSKQPEKNSSTHDGLLSLYVEWENSVVPGTIAQRTARLPLLLGQRRKPRIHCIVGARRGSAFIEISGGPIWFREIVGNAND